MSDDTRLPCSCTATHQPCPACRAWDARPQRVRRSQREDLPVPELRLRGLTHHYAPEACTPLLVPLTAWEVAWL